MKIFLIILCAFLLKTEAEAQTWQNISPKQSDSRLRNFQVFTSEGNAHQYVVVNSDTSIYVLKDGKSWTTSKSYNIYCFSQGTPPIYDIYYSINSIFRSNGDTVYLFYSGGGCGSIDGVAFRAERTTLEQLTKYRSDSVFSLGSYTDTYNGVYSPVTKKNYLLMGDWGNLRFGTFTSDNITWRDSIIPDTERSEYDVTGFAAHPQIATIYGIIRSRESNRVFSYREGDSAWNLISLMEKKEDNMGRPLNNHYQLAFGTHPEMLFVATSKGLWRYNDSTNQTDTLLKIPTRSIFFKENSDIAYAGTESGEIYRSNDAGETWSLFASGFSTKPVIGIYASGNDSLIVGTEDGIWANYALPVSVAEEIPFKNAELTITPNPANTSLKISFLKTELPQQLSIYNSLGQLVFKTEFSGEFVWDFKNEIGDGVYTVVVKTKNEIITKQCIIIR
ncbi:MAG: T9SS type A sorting domain-containing protein [Bacteroidota bacterium]